MGTTADSIEEQIINRLCDKILPKVDFKKNLLRNWHCELAENCNDVSSLQSVVENELILSCPQSPLPDELTARDIGDFLEELNKLKEEIYRELKVILLEIFFCIVGQKYNNRVKLHRLNVQDYFIDNFLKELAKVKEGQFEEGSILTLYQYFKILVLFSELGFNVKQTKKLIVPLFYSNLKPFNKVILLELLNLVFGYYTYNHDIYALNDFQSSSIAIPSSRNVGSQLYLTIFCTFKVVNNVCGLRLDVDIPEITLLTLSNSDDFDASNLAVKLKNFKNLGIEVTTKDFRFLHYFDQNINFLISRNKNFANIAITYDKYFNFNLYIDGEYSESTCFYGVSKLLKTWNKLYIGTKGKQNGEKSLELVLRDLLVLDMDLAYEKIVYLYYLSLSRNVNYKSLLKENIYNSLDAMCEKHFSELGIRIEEAFRNNDKENGPSSKLALRDNIDASYNTNSNKKDVFGISGDKKLLYQLLSSNSIKEEQVAYLLNNKLFQQLEQCDSSVTTKLAKTRLTDCLYSIGGSQLLIKLIELTSQVSETTKDNIRDTLLYKSLNLVFLAVGSDWRLEKELENICGYELLLILLLRFKEKNNKSLRLQILPEFTWQKPSELVSGDDQNLLNLILGYTGYDFINPSLSVIFNRLAYSSLILNFELYHNSDAFELLIYHIRVLQEGKYNKKNNFLLVNLKMLKRLMHFLKTLSVNNEQISFYAWGELGCTVESTLQCDPSVENLRAVSFFIIYMLFYNRSDFSEEVAVTFLNSLCDALCSSNCSIRLLKKFCRSISIHWLLLLLSCQSDRKINNSQKVVLCGLRLLLRLLKVLGSHTIKRFFSANHGLDILSRYLVDWWFDRKIVCIVYLAAFGVDIKDIYSDFFSLQQLSLNENTKWLSLMMPEFLLLLNNIVLQALKWLNVKIGNASVISPLKKRAIEDTELDYDELQLVNQYINCVKIGFKKNKALNNFYSSKYWLQGGLQLLGNMKLLLESKRIQFSRLDTAFESLRSLLSMILNSKLHRFSEFVELLKSFDEVSKNVMLDEIFPCLFDKISERVTQRDVVPLGSLEGAYEVCVFYFDEFINEHFYVTSKIERYINCIILILEVESPQLSKLAQKNLRKCLGEAVLIGLRIACSSEDSKENRHFSDVNADLDNGSLVGKEFLDQLKWLLYHQATILEHNVFNERQLSELLVLLMGKYLKFASNQQLIVSEYLFNFLRISYMMNQYRFENILHCLNLEVPYSESESLIREYFGSLLTKNDEDSLKLLQKYPTYKNIFMKNYHIYVGRFKEGDRKKVSNIIRVAYSDGCDISYMNNSYINTFEKDSDLLKSSIIKGEILKFNRTVQDRDENLQFFISSYNSLKLEVNRLIEPDLTCTLKSFYALDYKENSDRMRKKMIIENQLPDSEKLSYNIDIPIKHAEGVPGDSEEQYLDLGVINKNSELVNILPDDSFFDARRGLRMIEDRSDTTEENVSFEDKNRKILRSLYVGDQIIADWNVSQINGLVPIESLMILGREYIYLIENYFHLPDGSVVDIEDTPVELRDPYLQLVNSQSSSYLTENKRTHRIKSWNLEQLSCISKRQFLLRDIALEMFFGDGTSILLTVLSAKDRNMICSKLSSYASGKGLDKDLFQALHASSILSNSSYKTNTSSSLTSKLASAFTSRSVSSLLSATKKWRTGEMSNFYYLMIINTLAGRTFNDLTQYPVFPWIIADYSSETLDFSNPKTFRDLSKPMGGQAEPRANEFRKRYEALESLHDPDAPPFHYGTHYSSAMIVTSYLIRLKPYVQSYLLLQGGKFDHADRLFNSVEKAWRSASKDNTTDVRELTPEFFYLPEFLMNLNDFEFGLLQNGQKVNDVELPPWAKGDPLLFIAKNREALESPFVSANLHLWIDLVFGYKQNGVEAVESLNIFHHLSYNGAINLDNVQDDLEKRAIIGMINNFGQTPLKIFDKPHARKEVLNFPNQYMNLIERKEPVLQFESKLRLPVEKFEYRSKDDKWIGLSLCASSENDLLIRKEYGDNCTSLVINNSVFPALHLTNISYVLQIGSKLFLSSSDDGIIHSWRFSKNPASLQSLGVLRGHLSRVVSLKYSKNFKVALSADTDGIVFVWDVTRFKYIRKIVPPKGANFSKVKFAISNETGNIMILYLQENSNLLNVYTLNGSLIASENLKPGNIAAMNCAVSNANFLDEQQVPTYNHSYWPNEFMVFAYDQPSRFLDIYELFVGEEGFPLKLAQSIQLDCCSVKTITAVEILRRSEVDSNQKLCRGKLNLVLGDVLGSVYIM